MEQNKVVVRFKDGNIMKGKTADFFPTKKNFHLELLNGEIVVIDVEHLKAIFFVRDHIGDKDRKDIYIDMIPGGGRKIQVRFFDGETIIGYTQGYSPDRMGFFILPADKGSNNQRIFVLTSATEKVEFLPK